MVSLPRQPSASTGMGTRDAWPHRGSYSSVILLSFSPKLHSPSCKVGEQKCLVGVPSHASWGPKQPCLIWTVPSQSPMLFASVPTHLSAPWGPLACPPQPQVIVPAARLGRGLELDLSSRAGSGTTPQFPGLYETLGEPPWLGCEARTERLHRGGTPRAL